MQLLEDSRLRQVAVNDVMYGKAIACCASAKELLGPVYVEESVPDPKNHRCWPGVSGSGLLNHSCLKKGYILEVLVCFKHIHCLLRPESLSLGHPLVFYFGITVIVFGGRFSIPVSVFALPSNPMPLWGCF